MNTQRVEGHTPKGCPFCGVTPMQDGEDDTVYHPSLHYDKPKCILANMYFCEADWNKQANIERLEKVNEALVRALEDAHAHLEYCNYGDSWERECAIEENLSEKIEEALSLAKEPA